MHQLYLDLDAFRDPNPDRAGKVYLHKWPAAPTVVNLCYPPIGNTIMTKLHEWQILPSIVEANPHWLANYHIIANWVAWGDEADPVLPNSKKRKADRSSAVPHAKPKRPKAPIKSSEVAEAEHIDGYWYQGFPVCMLELILKWLFLYAIQLFHCIDFVPFLFYNVHKNQI